MLTSDHNPNTAPTAAPSVHPPTAVPVPTRYVNRDDRRLEVRLLAAYFTACTTTWRFRQVRDQYSRLYAVEDGSAEIVVRGRRVELEPGWLYLIPLHVTADYTCPRAMGLHWVHFRLEAMPGVDVFQHVVPPVALTAPVDVLSAMREIAAIESPHATPRTQLLAMARLTSLVAPFLPEEWDAMLPTSLGRLLPAFALLAERYADPRLSLGDLADACGYHPTYFSNLFTEVNGVTPMRYLCRYRLDKAKQYMLHADGLLEDIAHQCGFRDPPYFSRVFRRHEGRSPTLYRREFAASRP